MIFVPLPVFSVLLLCLIMVWFVRSRDMALTAHQVFLILLAAYTVQSALSTLRWGYDVMAAGRVAAFLAPVLPVVAYFAYASLAKRLRGARLWPVLIVLLNWVVLWLAPHLADALILATYLGFGALLARIAWKGPDALALSPLQNAQEIVWAIWLTAGTLMASGLTDIYVIVDFIRNEGRNVGLAVTVVQTVFVLLIGAAASFGRVARTEPSDETETELTATDEDQAVLDRIKALLSKEALHRSEDLSLRRIARKFGLPDRKVSNAINRLAGQSVSQFVNEYRVKDACDLLRQTEDTVLAVSMACGFATKSNFNREFRRVTGMTPSQWRQNGP